MDQGEQALTFDVALKVPEVQGEHTRLVSADPEETTKVPAGQIRLATQSVAGLPSSSHVAPPHATAEVLPPAQYSPLPHAEQMASDEDVAEAICFVPAWQSVAVRQNDSFEPVVRVPGAQVAHIRSDAAEGGLVTYELAGQTLHGVQVKLSLVALKVPDGQGAQVLSAMVEPELATKVPGAQTVQGLQELPERKVPSPQLGRHVPPTQVFGFWLPESG